MRVDTDGVLGRHSFRLKEFLGQATVIEEVESAVRSGRFLIGSDGCPLDTPDRPMAEIVAKPHVFCMTRDLMNKDFGSWTSALFVHQEPKIGFPPAEQRLLEESLHGGTEDEIAQELEIPISAVKKTWRSIYDRVERSSMDILPKSSYDPDSSDRGKGKKHRLLAYVREHPEELRPVSFKLLRDSKRPKFSRSQNRKPISSRA
jgi:DNA-binding NarL/FixJ family response regulator